MAFKIWAPGDILRAADLNNQLLGKDTVLGRQLWNFENRVAWTDNNGEASVSFAIPFPNAADTIIVGSGDRNVVSQMWRIVGSPPARTGFTVQELTGAGATNGLAVSRICFLAVGH